MKRYNKGDVRDIYRTMKGKGLSLTISRLENSIKCLPESGIHMHIRSSMNNTLNFLKDIKKDTELWKEVMVGSGSVNNGESWGDFYDYFPADEDKVRELFNKHQEETPFGNYVEL